MPEELNISSFGILHLKKTQRQVKINEITVNPHHLCHHEIESNKTQISTFGALLTELNCEIN